ncbi:hypothetical protein Tco_1196650, partial [Tanacetum coccineum]
QHDPYHLVDEPKEIVDLFDRLYQAIEVGDITDFAELDQAIDAEEVVDMFSEFDEAIELENLINSLVVDPVVA